MERTVFTAIVGNPNVGKSTLINRLVGSKIAITSHKPQTTRNRILGVVTKEDVQYVYLDTPGYHVPRTKLGEYMQKTVRETLEGTDVALFIVCPKPDFDENEGKLIEQLKKRGAPVVLAVNKIDTVVDEQRIFEYTESLNKDSFFSKVVLISALKNRGLKELEEAVTCFAKDGPFMFDRDELTDIPEKVIVSELIRECLLKFLSDELPHGTAVIIDGFKERTNGDIIDIDATIICEKKSHKGMIIGKNGEMLKKIASQARINAESFLGCRVNLKCWVKIREGWRDKDSLLRDIGIYGR